MTDAGAFRGFRVGHVYPLSLIRNGEKITGGAVYTSSGLENPTLPPCLGSSARGEGPVDLLRIREML